MIQLQINTHTYTIRNQWHEFTVSDIAKIEQHKPPQRFIELLNGTIKESDITHTEHVKTFPAYFGEVICACSDIPVEVMAYVHYADRVYMYSQIKSIVFDIITRSGISYEYQNLTTIEHDGTVYTLPETVEVMNMVVPLADMPAVDFSEASDVAILLNSLKESLSNNAALLCAIMLRDRSKPYNEAEVMKLAAKFETLSMDKFWEVFFSFTTALTLSGVSTLIYLSGQVKAAAQQLAEQ